MIDFLDKLEKNSHEIDRFLDHNITVFNSIKSKIF